MKKWYRKIVRDILAWLLVINLCTLYFYRFTDIYSHHYPHTTELAIVVFFGVIIGVLLVYTCTLAKQDAKKIIEEEQQRW